MCISAFDVALVICGSIKANCLTYVLSHNLLTHWGWGKMAVIFQTTFSNPFSRMKMYKFRLRFHWSLFPRVQLIICQHWLGAVQATLSEPLSETLSVYWHIYMSLGLNELIHLKITMHATCVMKMPHMLWNYVIYLIFHGIPKFEYLLNISNCKFCAARPPVCLSEGALRLHCCQPYPVSVDILSIDLLRCK